MSQSSKDGNVSSLDEMEEENPVHISDITEEDRPEEDDNMEEGGLGNDTGTLDGNPNDDNIGESHNELHPLDIILKTYFSFLDDGEVATVKGKLETLGVSCISDIKFLQEGIGIKEAFKDVLTAVQIGKLLHNLESQKTADESLETTSTIAVISFENIFSPKLLNELQCAESRVTDEVIKKVAWDLSDYLYATVRKPSMKSSQAAAAATVNRFKKALFLKKALSCKTTTIRKLGTTIFNHWKYQYRKDNKASKKGKSVNTSGAKVSFSKRESFGINAELDMPAAFPEGETRDSLVCKQTKLKEIYLTGEGSAKEIQKLMSETYVLQRFSVNEKLNMEKLLEQWPFFGKYKVLEKHFCRLMEVDMKEVESRLESFLPAFEKYLIFEGDRVRTGDAASMAPKIRNIMKEFKAYEKNATANVAGHQFAAVLMCLIIKLKENPKDLFIFFEETTSKDEIEASSKLPDDGTPRVAVLGKNIFEAERCFVVTEKRVISDDTTTLLKGIFSAFMLFWVLKLLYPRKLAGTLQFLEREMFCLNLDDNSGTSRVERGKDKKNRWRMCPPALNKRYLTCLEEYSSYCARWE